MKPRTITALLACAMSVALVTPTLAETRKPEGIACWTGDIVFLTTGEKHKAWSWNADITFTSNDKDPMKAAKGICVGSGAVQDGKPEVAPTFCLFEHAAGGKYMERAVGGSKANTGVYFGGTGKLAGITGSFAEGATTKRPAEKGKFSGCRPFKGEYTFPG